MSVILSTAEREMLNTIHVEADKLAKLLQEANAQGFQINFNMNAALGQCDMFQVVKIVPVDLKSGAN